MLLLEDKISKIIKVLENEIPEQFGPDNEDDYCGMSDVLHHALYTRGIEVEIYNGVSKLVIVPYGCSLVIKVPFNGSWYYGEKYNEEEDEWEYSEEENFAEFEYANDTDNYEMRNWDYCENELYKYEVAVEDGFEEVFPVTTFYDYIKTRSGSHPVYLQEKCEVFGSTCHKEDHKPSQKASDSFKSNRDKYTSRMSDKWVMNLIDAYGEDRTKEIIDYFNSTFISDDLHNDNIGYNSKGMPVVIDWSGWRD